MNERLENEVQHGKYLAARRAGEVWNWETPAGRVRWARRVKMLTAHLRPGQRVLELGCGTGFFTRALVSTGARVTAIDISPDLLEIARRECSSENVNFEVQNAYATNYADETFDSVLGSSVLHHLDLDAALLEIRRILKPGGSIYFTEPNMMNPQIAILKNVPAIKKRLGDSPDETAFFRWSLVSFLQKLGFRDIQITPFDFLHPAIPPVLIPPIQAIGSILEKLPVISEIAGSLYIRGLR